MAGLGEDDGYSDDDLDHLPQDAFYKLQQDAFQSTQQQPEINKNYWPTISSQPGEILNVRASEASRQLPPGVSPSRYAAPRQHPQPSSSDYGNIDEDMLDGEIYNAADQPDPASRQLDTAALRSIGETTQREQFIQQRHAVSVPAQTHQQSQHFLKPRVPANVDQRIKNCYNECLDSASQEILLQDEAPKRQDISSIPKSCDVNALEAQVQELLREREALYHAVESANANALSKTGEIAIVRANSVKTTKEYEARMVAMQRMHADETARHRLEVERQKFEAETARVEQGKIATELAFDKRELAKESEERRNLEKIVKGGGAKATLLKGQGQGSNSPLTTPKKNKGLSFGDGFSDDEVNAVSPSKIALRTKVSTPKAGAKRKRKPLEGSPSQALQLIEPITDASTNEVTQVIQPSLAEIIAQGTRQEDKRFQFTQNIMNHRIKHDQRRSFEALADFAFPSNPTCALSTIILDKMSLLSVKRDIEDFPAALGLIVISLWAQCINETYYQPLRLLMDLVKFILLLSPIGTAPHLVDSIIALVQVTADVNAIPRFKRKPVTELKPEIDTSECLQILHLIAYGCRRDKEDTARFWRCMRFDFLLMILNVTQPLEEIHLMLQMLRTSIFEESFAMIIPPRDGDQRQSEKHVIDSLSALLIDMPKATAEEKPCDVTEIAELRLQVLDLLERMCETNRGGEALAKNPFTIGKLVRLMNDELDALYDYQYGFEYKTELVNQSTRLLYHLTSTYAPLINMQEKLRIVPGGTHKHLIVLTRLAFSESVFYERGIEDDVVDCAHRMLEDVVTPEEGEALLEAFSSARK